MEKQEKLEKLIKNIERVIVGKTKVIKLAITCLLAKGHLLLEDIPGTGKTTLALAIARSIHGNFHRIQFTADLLPTDITGVSLYHQEKKEFEFRKGPIFANIVLADEINRGTPKVQSGLLEAMNESQVTVDGITYQLPPPFFVLATQNPMSFAGTYPLLVAQLDRFLMKTSLGYLSPEEEILMMKEQKTEHPIKSLKAVLSQEDISELQEKTKTIKVDDSIYQYIVDLVNATRSTRDLRFGVSHRGTLSLFRAARAFALVEGRDYVLPDDIKKLFIPIVSHRVISSSSQMDSGLNREVLENILAKVSVPL